MASIYPRNKKWLVRWYDLGGRECNRTCPTHGSAKRLKLQIEEARAEGRDWAPDAPTRVPLLLELSPGADGVEEISGGLWHEYLMEIAVDLEPKTLKSYQRALVDFVEFVAEKNKNKRRGGARIDELSHAMLVAHWGELIGRMSIASARERKGCIARAWTWAYEHEIYGQLVSRPRKFKVPPRQRRLVVAPTWAEMDAVYWKAVELAKTCRRGFERVAWAWRAEQVAVMRYTGLRVSQVMRMRWDDVDLEAATLDVRPELGKSDQERAGRTIPICPALVEHLSRTPIGERSGWLVAPGLTYRQVDTKNVNKLWGLAGIREACWRRRPDHAFRKGFTSGLKRLGADDEAAEYLVGRVVAGGTSRADYIDPDALPLRDAVGRVPAIAPLRIVRRAER